MKKYTIIKNDIIIYPVEIDSENPIEDDSICYFDSVYEAQEYLIKRELEAIQKAQDNIKEIRELYEI